MTTISQLAGWGFPLKNSLLHGLIDSLCEQANANQELVRSFFYSLLLLCQLLQINPFNFFFLKTYCLIGKHSLLIPGVYKLMLNAIINTTSYSCY